MTVDADPNTDADFIVDIGDPAACQEILRATEGCVVESIRWRGIILTATALPVTLHLPWKTLAYAPEPSSLFDTT